MSPDRAFGKPADVHKRTTKVNIAVVLAVSVFFLIGAAGIYWMWRHSSG